MMQPKSPHERYLPKPYVGSSHTWVLRQLAAVAPDAAVLDIGPGSGFLGQFLRERGVVDLTAQEIDAATRQQLAGIYSSIVASDSELGERSFDVVLLMDVIEHVADPQAMLLQAYQRLKEGGLLLLSVPNVAHWSVRIPLLLGFFEYRERGILDRSHLQFFTRRRCRTLLQRLPQANLLELSAALEPCEFVLPRLIWDNFVFKTLRGIQLQLAQLWPGLWAYQHLAALRRKGIG